MRRLSALQEACDDEAMLEFAREAGLGLAQLGSCDLAEGNLSLVFALSAWLRFAGVGVPGACSGLLGLRRTLLEASSLDQHSEPIPLVAGDPRSALLSLATYVHGLIGRSARHAHKSTTSMVEEALALLG
jgi:hypothetical protein